LNKLQNYSNNIINLINSSLSTNLDDLKFEAEISLDVKDKEYAKDKIEILKDINFGTHFLANLARDYYLDSNFATKLLNEYTKFLFVLYHTKSNKCPSEEVDLIWHYHQLNTKNYLDFSQKLFGKKFLSHNPADGSLEDHMYFKNLYNETIESMKKIFKTIDIRAWPEDSIRFKQVFKCYNHYTIMQRCRNSTQSKEAEKSQTEIGKIHLVADNLPNLLLPDNNNNENVTDRLEEVKGCRGGGYGGGCG